jgi:hypothetical protein
MEGLFLSKQPSSKAIQLFPSLCREESLNFIVLARVLEDQGIQKGGFVTGPSADPTALAWRFSPVSNEKPILVFRQENFDGSQTLKI